MRSTQGSRGRGREKRKAERMLSRLKRLLKLIRTLLRLLKLLRLTMRLLRLLRKLLRLLEEKKRCAWGAAWEEKKREE